MASQPYKNSIWAASFCYAISVIFLLLVVIGNTANKAGIRNIYFFQLELSNIIPLDAPNAVLLNSVARSLGLHDFYQVGLWNFCEGYNDEYVLLPGPTSPASKYGEANLLLTKPGVSSTVPNQNASTGSTLSRSS